LLLEEGPTVGIHFIVCGDYSVIGSSYEPALKYVRRQSTIGLLTMKLADQDMFSQPVIRKERYPDSYDSYYAMDDDHINSKIPEEEGERLWEKNHRLTR